MICFLFCFCCGERSHDLIVSHARFIFYFTFPLVRFKANLKKRKKSCTAFVHKRLMSPHAEDNNDDNRCRSENCRFIEIVTCGE